MRGGAGQSSERPSVRAVSSTKDVTQRLDSVSRSKAAREREPAKVIAWRVWSVLWRIRITELTAVSSEFLMVSDQAGRGIAVVVTTHGVSARFRTLIRNVTAGTEGLERDPSWPLTVHDTP